MQLLLHKGVGLGGGGLALHPHHLLLRRPPLPPPLSQCCKSHAPPSKLPPLPVTLTRASGCWGRGCLWTVWDRQGARCCALQWPRVKSMSCGCCCTRVRLHVLVKRLRLLQGCKSLQAAV